MKDTFGSAADLRIGGRTYRVARLDALDRHGRGVDRLPYSLRILLECLLRNEDGKTVTAEDIEALAAWDPVAAPAREIAFTPALMQDFTGVPAVVDLAAMRDAMRRMNGDPRRINPLLPTELVIDHSVQVDEYGTRTAFHANAVREFERNRERYAFLKWGQGAFDRFKVVPPATGIVHQVNLEYLARVVMAEPGIDGLVEAYPDTLVGTDSHTTMVNGLGVLGWGVGGIEAEAAMLGQPVSMLIPQVVGFRLSGRLPEGATATDLVLTVTEMLRAHGVVGKFVEFYGPGLANLPLADRATIANMAPEYGATCGIFPVDAATLDYLRLTGRPGEQVALVEAYTKEQGLFRTEGNPDPAYSDSLGLDLATIEPSLAGPKRPQDRIRLGDVKLNFKGSLAAIKPGGNGGGSGQAADVAFRGTTFPLGDGAVVIAAITSCTNTSNPSVMIAAGLLAKKAVERGLATPPWVKTSLAPGSKVVTDYLETSGLTEPLEALGFHLVGYGCTTCIGNSGPLPEPIAKAIEENGLVAASVLSGNRNFEGRINSHVRANYLASPPLVVAYALAGRMDVDLTREPLGKGADGEPVYLRDIWPSPGEVQAVIRGHVTSDLFRARYRDAYEGDENWRGIHAAASETYAWDASSTYVKHPPYFDGMGSNPAPIRDIENARVLAMVGDSITTDHISPAGSIQADSPAGRYLREHGVSQRDFNSYGSRRGNHEVMMRGTFANVRFRNLLNPDVEGGQTTHLPDGDRMPIFDAAMRYREEGVPLVLLAGREYGTGSSRDWAAKGPALLGVRAVIARSFERIHRSNLLGMGILPLEFPEGQSAESLGLTGRETYTIAGLARGFETGFPRERTVTVKAVADEGRVAEFDAGVRIDTPQEMEYYRHGGILHYVLRRLLASPPASSRGMRGAVGYA